MEKKQSNSTFYRILILLAIALVASSVLSIFIGAVSISPKDILQILANKILGKDPVSASFSKSTVNIVWELRFPKVLGAICIGSSLSLAGIQMQSLTKNPLADPFILGISSGASMGAVFILLLGKLPILGPCSVQLGAFAGALLASVCIFLFAGWGRADSTRLVLTGLALSSIFGSITTLLIFITPDSRKVQSALFWMTGSLSSINWQQIPLLLLVSLFGIVVSLVLHRHMDILLMGEERARSLGLDTAKVKKILILVSSLLTGVMVSLSGVIGFVGLVVPHIGRSLLTPAHRKLIPISMLLASTCLLLSDSLARFIARPEELPLGVITALAGAPFFLWLLQRSKIAFGDRS